MIPHLKASAIQRTRARVVPPESRVVPSVSYPATYDVGDTVPGTYGTSGIPSADHANGVFGAPLGSSPEEIAIRRHEYGHLHLHRTSPELDRLRDLVPPDWYQQSLDCIVNGMCDAAGVDISALPIVNNLPHYATRLQRAVHALQFLSTGRTRKSFDGLAPEDLTLIKELASKLRGYGRYARQRLLRSDHIDQIVSLINSIATHFDKPTPTFPPTISDGEIRAIATTRPDLPGIMDYAEREGFTTDVPWCPCSIVERPLTRRVPRKWLTPRRRAGYVGAFRNPLRALLPAMDGRAWSTKLKREGGSILLDQSGSMHIKPEDVLRLLESAPYATIAAYSGDQYKGEVRILARNGRYTTKCDTDMVGNCVDGPALDWLASQAAPRVWICDGIVTGRGDVPSVKLSRECIAKCLAYNIYRIESLGQYFEEAHITPHR